MASYKTGSGRRLSETLAGYTQEEVVPVLGGALYAEGSGILEQSLPLVPVLTGALRASGYVKPPELIGSRISVVMGYGGVASQKPVPLVRGTFKVQPGGAIGGRTYQDPMRVADPSKYAIYVHENLEAHHPVGIAKYLELPFNQALPGMGGRVADYCRIRLSGIAGRSGIGDAGPDVDYNDVVY